MSPVEEWVEKTKKECEHIPVLSLEMMRELPEAREFDGGVYFLWLNDALQYVGKSHQIVRRLLLQHWATKYTRYRAWDNMKPIQFDRNTCIALHSDRVYDNRFDGFMQDCERAYIAHYMPPYNDLGPNPGT